MAFQTALQFWKDLDLPTVQTELDKEATAIAQRQDESDVSVRKLVELTREFKRSAPEDVRKRVSPLIKAFQSEVDYLTKRSNAAETAFLNAYKRLIEIPNPVLVLEQAVSQQQRLRASQDLEVENKQLRETLKDYNTEFAQVKNQEVTIMKLKEQIRELESTVEDKAAARAAEKESELAVMFQQQERELQQSSSRAQSRMTEAESRTSMLQSALEATQSELFELKNRFDEEATARAAEVEILVTDLERANARVAAVERELETAQQSHEQPSFSSPKVTDTTELEVELRTKEREVSRLLEDVQRLQSNLSQLRDNASRQVAALEEELKGKKALVEKMEEKLSQQQDYDEIKKELDIIKIVEFPAHQETQSTPSKPLEVLLLEKNRALVNENTSLKTELAELRDHFASLQSQHDHTLQSAQDQKQLITQLESDLARVRPFLPPRTEGEGQASPSEIMAEVVREIQPERKTSSDKAGGDSLLSIVTSQRERFKQRNSELDAECQQYKQTVTVLQREVDSLRGDNVKLYEKIRFLQSYPGTRKTAPDDTTLTRYSSQYEATLDPFSSFTARERQRKYHQLSGPDKATLTLGRFILSNKIARMVAFCYTILLHLLVFLVLFKLANTADCERDLFAECARKFTEHMQIVHSQDQLAKTFAGGGGKG